MLIFFACQSRSGLCAHSPALFMGQICNLYSLSPFYLGLIVSFSLFDLESMFFSYILCEIKIDNFYYFVYYILTHKRKLLVKTTKDTINKLRSLNNRIIQKSVSKYLRINCVWQQYEYDASVFSILEFCNFVCTVPYFDT